MADNAGPAGDRWSWRVRPVEMAIGIGLVVIAAVLIVGIIRTVSANQRVGG